MSNNTIPGKVVEAFDHVRSIHPQVVRVVYLPDSTWRYLDAEGDAPAFDKNVDTSLLEEGMNQALAEFICTSYVLGEDGHLTADDDYVRRIFEKSAREQHHRDGECEIDEGAEVSFSENFVETGGAYVRAWVWVENPFAK